MQPNWQQYGLAVLRILTGGLMAYHGWEIFHAAQMKDYAAWEQFKNWPAPLLMVYLGKGLELVTGICFVIGAFTRIAALLMAVNMLTICFFIGNGQFYYADQHPFLFAVLALVYFFNGAGVWSLDSSLFQKRNHL
jgi:putative oxidoreductase